MQVGKYDLNTGADIPAIGFGTWQLKPWDAKSAVNEALKTGYRLIDTAKIYLNEGAVGKAIKESGLNRNDIFVTTKLWNGDQGYESAKKAFEKSLKKLKTDYVDLYLIHWPVTGKRLDSWRALEEIFASGRAKAIGVSNFTIEHLEELMGASKIVPAVNQVEFHPFLYEEQKPLLDFCKKHGIVVEAYSPLAHGRKMNDPILQSIGKTHQKSGAQVMLRWALQHGTVPLPKATSPEHIKQNLDIFNFELTDKEMAKINSLSSGLRTCWNPSDMP